MKKDFIGTLHMGAVILWLAVSLLFAGIGFIPASVATRPIRRWAFCVQRACEKLAKRQYVRMMLEANRQTEIEIQKFITENSK